MLSAKQGSAYFGQSLTGDIRRKCVANWERDSDHSHQCFVLSISERNTLPGNIYSLDLFFLHLRKLRGR